MIKRIMFFTLFCLMTFSVISCTIGDVVEIVTESIIEEFDKPSAEEPAPVVEENEPEDYIMEIKAIKQFSNYVVAPNAVYGINGINLEKLKLVDKDDIDKSFSELFVSSGDIYFSIENIESGDPIPDTDPVQYEQIEVTHYFKQSGTDINEVAALSYPAPPASEHIEFESEIFKIVTTPYDIEGVMTSTSRVYKGSPVVGYLKIDGYVLTEEGLWFSVAETIKTRHEGVYLWTIERSSPNRVLESGRIF